MYRVDTDTWSSNEFTSRDKAEIAYELYKNNKLASGVDFDSYVELIFSDDDFDNYIVLKRAEIVEDEQQYKDVGTPEENGMEFQFWAKWKEVTM